MNKYIKFVIAFLLFVLSITFFKNREPGYGILSILIGIINIFLFFRNEFLLLAFFRIRKQDMKGLEKWLSFIKKPTSQLIKSQQAYFYFLNGILSNAKGEKTSQTENYMKKALEIGLLFKHDRAIAKLNLAIAVLSKGKKKEAEALLKEAKILDTAGFLKEQITLIKTQMKKSGISRQTQNPYMRNMRR